MCEQKHSRLVRSVDRFSVPPKPTPPLVRVTYTAEGEYVGRLDDGDEVKEGVVVKMEPALW